jgi:hypothetical protein
MTNVDVIPTEVGILLSLMQNTKQIFQKGISNIIIILIVILILAAIGFLAWYFIFGQDNNDDNGSKSSDVPIKERFENKIIYTSNQDADVDKLKQHCREEGGEFNECGSVCAPDAAACAQVCAYTCELDSDKSQIDTSDWKTFESEEYGFSLKYPSDWNMEAAPNNEIAPKFNFYIKPSGVPVDAPFNHHANISNVSVFPEGIPTEGLLGESQPLIPGYKVNFKNTSKTYVLEDGTFFASYIQLQSTPDSWNESGFVWNRLRVENLEEKCLREGEVVTDDQCQVLGGDDRIVRSGSVNEKLWRVQQAVINSIEFTEDEGGSPAASVELESPREGEVISSPLTVEGQAPGSWFFEGEFSVVLTDWDGEIIAEASARTQEDWMTENMVPFEATLEFEKPYDDSGEVQDFMKNGNLILQKANPSGLPENDAAKEIRIRFE